MTQNTITIYFKNNYRRGNTLKKILISFGFLILLFSATMFCSAAEQKSAIINFSASSYDVREDFQGELGYAFKTINSISIDSVSVPYFEGNVTTKLVIYKAVKSPELDTHYVQGELEAIYEKQIKIEKPNNNNEVVIKLDSPLLLENDKEYLITYFTGVGNGFDCKKFYNSGRGSTPKSVEFSADINVISCVFALAENGENEYAKGAPFALNRQVPGTVFGFPNFTYSVTKISNSNSNSKKITQDDFEEIKIPGTDDTQKQPVKSTAEFNFYSFVLLFAIIIVLASTVVGIITTISINKKQ